MVIAAAAGEFEAGFAKSGETRSQTMMSWAMGGKPIIMVINKMDDRSVQWSKTRFDEIKDEVSAWMKRFGHDPSCIPFVPISGMIW